MQITRHCPDSHAGPSPWFTGEAWIEEITALPWPSRLRVSSVTFTPGARTVWHRHPVGQVLHVTTGAGLVQRAGGPIEEISAGDTVWIEPTEWHWHGAGPRTVMTHLAVQETDADGVEADCGQPVDAADYPT